MDNHLIWMFYHEWANVFLTRFCNLDFQMTIQSSLDVQYAVTQEAEMSDWQEY